MTAEPGSKLEMTLPNLQDWPIYLLSEDRAQFIEDITEHTLHVLDQKYQDGFEQLLSKTIYLEKIRLKEEPWKADPPQEKNFWKKTQERLTHSFSAAEKNRIQEELLKIIVHRYAEEIVGNFRIKTFLFARKFLTAFFSRLLNTAAERNHRRLFSRKHALTDKLNVHGPLDKIRSLSRKGTIVLVPTHFSNLDSILIGYALDAVVGLPAFSYGAGLNLYNSEMVGYFFNRLGAYRIDRRKKNMIYLEVLKAMSSLSIERGVHSLFFPGGTRSRNGALEDRFKLGLLGTVIEAQRRSLENNKNNKIYIVPLVLGYHSVLEANFLINQHLTRTGREKYWDSKDEFNSLRSILKFAWQFFSQGSDITLSFGEPIDIAGNQVNDLGESLNENGQIIRIEDYFSSGEAIEENNQREQVYTRKLSEEILRRFKSENIVLDSHLVAFAAFHLLLMNFPNLDVFGLIRIPSDEYTFDLEDLYHIISKLLADLRILEAKGEIKLSEKLNDPVEDLVKSGVQNLGIFHTNKPLRFDKQQNLVSDDFKLLYYYHNRLTLYDLEKSLEDFRPKKSRKELSAKL